MTMIRTLAAFATATAFASVSFAQILPPAVPAPPAAPRVALPAGIPAPPLPPPAPLAVPAVALPAPFAPIAAVPPAPLAPQVPAPPAVPVPVAPEAVRLPPLPPAWPDVVWPEVPDFAFAPNLDIDVASLDIAVESARAVAEAYAQSPFPVPAPPAPPNAITYVNAGSLYDQARDRIDRDQYDRALELLDRLIAQRGTRTDAAMYWKAYSQLKLARPADALATLAALQKDFPKSAWVDDARKLELEARQASGQPVSADAVDDEEVRLLALQGLMQNDPDAALPYIEKMLAGSGSVRLKDRALYVVSRSRSPRGREIITGVAKGNANPDLRRSAVRLLGRMAGADSAQTLDEIYRGTSDIDLKRAALRGLLEARATDRLAAVARSESSTELRGEAVQYLGALKATGELEELYRSESNADLKRRILQSLGPAADKLIPLVRAEKDPQLRLVAIRQLGASNTAEASAALTALYNSDSSLDVRKAAIDALGMQQRNAAALVSMARAEKNAELKTYIVRRLSNMRAPEAREYMLELLK